MEATNQVIGDPMGHTVQTSRNEGKAKEDILGFVKRATTEGPDFIPLAERIDTFDNDGTPWVE